MAGGILAGFVTSFLTAAVELSATIMLVTAQSHAPMSYGIYLYMQSIAGRGPGAALGVVAVVIGRPRHLFFQSPDSQPAAGQAALTLQYRSLTMTNN